MPIAISMTSCVLSQAINGPSVPRCSRSQVWPVPVADREFQLLGKLLRGEIISEPEENHPDSATGVHVLDVHQLAEPHDRDPVGDLFDLRQDMPGEDHRLTARPRVGHEPEHVVPGRGIEGGRGFIENQDIDRIGERLREGRASASSRFE